MNVKVLLNHTNTFAETQALLREMTQIALKTSKKRSEMHIQTTEILRNLYRKSTESEKKFSVGTLIFIIYYIIRHHFDFHSCMSYIMG